MMVAGGAVIFMLFWAVAVILGLCVFGLWVWSLIDCLTRSDDSFEPTFGSVNPKIIWAVIIFFAHILGTIIYLLVAGTKANPKCSASRVRTADPEESRRILEMIASGKITAAEGQRLLAALGTKAQQSATQQANAPAHKALKVGCLVLLAIPVLLVLIAVVFRLFASAPNAPIARHEAMMQQAEKQIRLQLNNGETTRMQIKVTNVPVSNDAASATEVKQ